MPIPPDTRGPGDLGHIGDHNNISDTLTALASVSPLAVPAADPSGGTDSTAAINTALAGAASGQTVALQEGTFQTTGPLLIPQGVTLAGPNGGFGIPIGNYGIGGLPANGAVIKPAASFSGAAVILLAVSGAVQSGQQQVRRLSIDASNVTGTNTIHAIQGINGTAAVKMRDVLVYGGNGKLGGNGLDVRPGANSLPDLWDVSHCHFSGMGGDGVKLNGLADSYFFAVESTGNTGDSWNITNGNNSRFVGCKGEGSSAGAGWNLTAATGFTGQLEFVACTSSVNHLDGTIISGPGAGVWTFDACRSNNDGVSGGTTAGLTVTGSFAGTVQGSITVVPGGSSNPPNALKIASAANTAQVLLANSVLWGFTTAVSNDASAGNVRFNSTTNFATGALASPAWVTNAALATDLQPAGPAAIGTSGRSTDPAHVHPDMFGGYGAMGAVVGQTSPLLTASTNGAAAATGTLIMLLTEVPVAGKTTTAANFWITTAGSSLASVYVIAVNASTGAIVGQTANRASDSALTTSGSLWSPPWSASFTPGAADYYTAVLIGSGTGPVFRGNGGLTAAAVNLGTSVAAGNARVCTYGSGLSAVPASPLTLSSMVIAADAKWCAWT